MNRFLGKIYFSKKYKKKRETKEGKKKDLFFFLLVVSKQYGQHHSKMDVEVNMKQKKKC